MTQKHTPGRFVLKGRTGSAPEFTGSLYRIADETGHYVCFIPSWESVDAEAAEADANASRIAAAWNACEGIPTAALDAGVVADMLEALQGLERVLLCLMDDPSRADEIPAVIAARAARARATGAA